MRGNGFTVCVLLGVSLSQAQTTTASKDAAATTLLQNSLAAIGTSPAAGANSVASGTITFYNGGSSFSSPITLKAKDETAFRTELAVDGKPSISVVNNGIGSKRQDEKAADLPLWTTKYQLPEYLIGLRLKQALNVKTNVAYLGIEEVAGQSCHRIQVYASPPPGIPAEQEKMISEFDLFIDAKTFLVAKTKGYIFSAEIIENRSLLETYYSDYRSLDGMLIPFRITHYLSGSPYSEIVLDNVNVNATLASSDFE